jgi:RNA polymerase sigma-70 factor (ECF subfamily)
MVRPGWLFARGLRQAAASHILSNTTKGSFGQTAEAAYDPSQPLSTTDSISQDSILPRLAAGEPRAMNECIDRFGGLVWSIVRRALHNESEAEDLVQEVFTEIWKKAGFYDAEVASEATFIALVARRRTIDHLRRAGRQPGFEPLEAAESLPAAAAPAMTAACDPEAVKASIASLPDDTRRLFRMFFEDGFTHPEIAEKTGLPLGTVKTRLRRGLISLREQLRRAGITHIQPAS